MAEQMTLARPYARAAFDCASDAELLDSWAQALARLATAAVEKRIAERLVSPMSIEDKLNLLTSAADVEADERLSNLLKLLAEKRRLPLLPEISRLFQRLLESRRQAVEVEISVAFDTDAATLDKLGQALEKKLGRSLQVHAQVDETLIGGAVVRVGDAITDGSVRGRLRGLADAIRQ